MRGLGLTAIINHILYGRYEKKDCKENRCENR